jgi:hypothetical protein
MRSLLNRFTEHAVLPLLLNGGGGEYRCCCDWWLRWFTMSHLPPGYLVLPKSSRGSLRAALLGRRAPGIDSGGRGGRF